MIPKTIILFPLIATAANGATIIASADTYIQKGDGVAAPATTNFGSASEIVVKGGNGSTTRKIYLLFDLSGITSTITEASLSLTINLNDSNTAKTIEIATPNAQSTTFTENSLTWVNAPGHNTASNAFSDATTLFTGQSIGASLAIGTIVTFSNQALIDYLNAEVATGNKEAMLMIRRTDTGTGPNLAFRSKENTTINGTTSIAPTLTYTLVPEPSAALLSALGGLVLLRRKR